MKVENHRHNQGVEPASPAGGGYLHFGAHNLKKETQIMKYLLLELLASQSIVFKILTQYNCSSQNSDCKLRKNQHLSTI